MTSTGLASRQRSAYAAKQEAKQRRQRIFAVVGLVLFLLVAAYEVPHTLKLLHHGSSGSPVASSAPVATPKAPSALPASVLHRQATDPFVARTFSGGDPGVGTALPGRDPFAAPPAPRTNSAASAAPAAPQGLPQTIVLGKPGKGLAAVHGWIVILASIPTGDGRDSAASFERRAAGSGLTSLGILNSSNRRPLRGGYWVVYAGPYGTLGEVSKRAAAIHAAGYGSAYIRGLLVYR
jgi:hypothetical protein